MSAASSTPPIRSEPTMSRHSKNHKIESIELADDITAFPASAAPSAPTTLLTFLFLVRINGQWLIIVRVLNFVERATRRADAVYLLRH